ncbi:protein CBFA2T1-like isoform X4 [Argiope bruennichi]|uniref:protein CBFA2T1-like isoform X4 n=1 Tax=Argiope bruennichi TaxID=94029 RepID=UPI0024950098|nr:protein CBFA2T1-like isoform X4 [Argiope bruennichi]
MTGDILLSNMLFRYRDLPIGIKMPDSPESLIKNQITSNSASGVTGVNGNHSPHPPGGTPSPPINSLSSSNSVPHHLDLPGGNGTSRSKHVIKVKRFLATLQQFASDMSVEVGERVHSLIIGLVSSSVSIEDFHHKIQEITNYPLRPFAIPFLKSHLPILQTELIHFSRMAKQTPQQYLRQHEHVILDTSSHPSSEPFEIFQSSADAKENGKRRSPPSRNGKLDVDYSETNGDGPPPAKRHHPIPSPTLSSRTSPGAPSGLGLPPSLNLRLPDDTVHPYRDREGRMDRYDRFERDFYRPFYGNMSREYSDDREMEEEWRNIHTMLNCILGMVEKTKRALCILQHRSYAERAELTSWIRHPEMEPKKRPSDIVSHFKIAEDRVTEVRRRAEEAVNEVKRQAVAELQKAVSAAESKASELVAAERIKMERMLAEARRQAAEDALAVATHQEESTEMFSSSTTRTAGIAAGRPVRLAAAATSHGTAVPSASTKTGNLITESAVRLLLPSQPHRPPALHPGQHLTTVRALPEHRPWLMSNPSRLI